MDGWREGGKKQRIRRPLSHGLFSLCYSTAFSHVPSNMPSPHAGLVGAYSNSFNYVGLSGPTYFEQASGTAVVEHPLYSHH